ncbi:MAG: NAD(P)/FAD-dependent oxidoreductase [Acidimicrobiia bacterium]|nr:NAD(P)/FAD-dependent oxidoreductase [Acidimicrobiia bacterium]NNF10457.1 NAD(P)/FAD-dependent oxidoreductase [Acidimicrobiia bacterium]
MSRRYAVIGGGVLGLTLALRLSEAGHEVTVFERAETIGGLASAWSIGDITWDRHYHVTLGSDDHVLWLLDRLGLSDEIRWANTRTAVYAGGRLHSVSTPLELLRFPPLRLVNTVRLAANLAYATRIRDWRRLEAIPVATWLRRWSGRRTFDEFWKPLLESKLGEAYRETSAAFIWATVQRLTAARRHGMTDETFGYVAGGYARVFERFESVLRERGVRFQLGAAVGRVGRSGDELTVELAGGDKQDFDAVVVTAAAPIAARLCEGLNDEERMRLEAIRYLGIVCPSVLVRGHLPDFYITNITDPGLPFTGIINMSALVGPFDGHSLVYLPRYVAPTDPLFEASDAAIEDDFVAGLRRVVPSIEPDDIVAVRTSKVRAVMALPALNYSERVPRIETSVPGLYLVSSANIINGTLNVNETLQLADRASELIA